MIKKYLLIFLFYCTALLGATYSDLVKECTPEQRIALQEASDYISEETQFQPLVGGLSKAKLYSFETGKDKLVLRFLSLGPTHPQEMRQNEIRALKIANELGIAPPCIFSDENSVLMIMPFVEGCRLQNPKDDQLLQLGKMIRSLQQPSRSFPTNLTLADRVGLQYQKGLKSGIAFPRGFDHEVETLLSKPVGYTPVPSHGDLNPSNILVSDSSISIIDWTTATLDSPFTDLSYLSLLLNLSPSQESKLLESYFGRAISEEEEALLNEEKAKLFLFTAALCFRCSETEEERSLPIEARIAALDSELHSPNLKPVQDYLGKDLIDLHNAPKAAIKSYALSFYKAYLETRLPAGLPAQAHKALTASACCE